MPKTGRTILMGVLLGSIITLLGAGVLAGWVATHGPGQYFAAQWLVGLWLGSAFAAGFFSGGHSNQKGAMVGGLTGLIYGFLTAVIVYSLAGWLAYSLEIISLALAGGFAGGALGINLRYFGVQRGRRRRRVFSRL